MLAISWRDVNRPTGPSEVLPPCQPCCRPASIPSQVPSVRGLPVSRCNFRLKHFSGAPPDNSFWGHRARLRQFSTQCFSIPSPSLAPTTKLPGSLKCQETSIQGSLAVIGLRHLCCVIRLTLPDTNPGENATFPALVLPFCLQGCSK